MRSILCSLFSFLPLAVHPYEQLYDEEGGYALVCSACTEFRRYVSVQEAQVEKAKSENMGELPLGRPVWGTSMYEYPSRTVESVDQELRNMGIDPEVDRPSEGIDKMEYQMMSNDGSPLCSGKVVIMLKDQGESQNHSAKVKLISECDCVFGHLVESTFSYRLEDLVPA